MPASRDWSDELAGSARWLLMAFPITVIAFLLVAVLLLRVTTWGQNFWTVTGEFFTGRTAVRAIPLVGVLLLSAVASVRVQVLLSYQGNDMYSALQSAAAAIGSGDDSALGTAQNAFWHSMAIFALLASVEVLRTQLDFYLGQIFEIVWRRWLTDSLTGTWIGDRAYYRARFIDEPIDNPDQRIQQDVGDMIASARLLSLGAVTAVVSVVSFTRILWDLSEPLTLVGFEIPRAMVFLVFAYVLAATTIAFRLGRPLIRLGFRYQAVMADFRYALVRLRENAERIAFYRGGGTENAGLRTLFTEVLRVYYRLVLFTTRFIGWNQAATETARVFPWLIQAPHFFAGTLTLGDVTQTGTAFGQIQESLSFFRNSYSQFAAFRATLMRLYGLVDASAQSRELPTIGVRALDGSVELTAVDVSKPDGAVLIAALNLRLRSGDAVVVKGLSGSGKTTLLRAIAEMWPYTRGVVGRPEAGATLFISQLPYLPLGDLRAAVTYPAAPDSASDAAVRAVLIKVQLGHLETRLDEQADWANILSPGEQQRLAFARIILIRPEAAFLDEATSAVDEGLEFALYTLIRAELPDLILISTAHRTTVDQHHTARLELKGGGDWSFVPNQLGKR
ncbi:ABC transporter ATP-binding protein/permease [Nocardia sp. NPDC052112]|uniref:ABC transporter ATP-binding protein/permease n=1 Tax=Nocardia sp. NPDC052112 TaxID=3155646 RepID=UPI003427AB40